MKTNKIRGAFAEIRADAELMDQTAAYLRQKSAERQQRRKASLLPKAALAATAVLAVLIPVFTYNLYFTAAAYVSIDVNPSLELSLNRFEKVIDSHAFNEDGQIILSDTAWHGKSYDEATALLLDSMQAGGFMRGNVLISVSVQTANNEQEQLLCASLQQLITERLQTAPAIAEVEVFSVSAEVWSNAHGCHISPAKYLAIQELLAVDEEASLEAYSNASITQIRGRMRQCHSNNTQDLSTDNTSPAYDQPRNMMNQHGHGSRHNSF